MKKLFYLLLALPLFVACTENNEEPKPEPQPEKKAQLILTSDEVMNFKAEGGQGLIDYTLVNPQEGVEFAAQCEAAWISDFVFGEDITFVVAANEGEDRETKITITYAEASMEVTIKQAKKAEEPAAPAIVITSDNPMEFDMNGGIGTITYTIENPMAGVSLTAKADAAWIAQTTVQAEKIIFQVLANEVEEAREGKITLTYGMLEPVEVIVKQAAYAAPAPVFTFTPESLEVAVEGGAQSVTYTIENAIEGAEVVATCEAAWVSNLAVADGTMTFDVAANEESLRQAIITLTYGDYAFEYTTATGTVAANLLEGTVTDTEVTGKGYVLSTVDSATGFYAAELDEEGKFKNNAGKAYLPASAVPAGARFLSFDFGTETAIESIEGAENAANAVIYDLSGRRVQKVQKGLYIVNGVKVIK
jgi:hypothetical protein